MRIFTIILFAIVIALNVVTLISSINANKEVGHIMANANVLVLSIGLAFCIYGHVSNVNVYSKILKENSDLFIELFKARGAIVKLENQLEEMKNGTRDA